MNAPGCTLSSLIRPVALVAALVVALGLGPAGCSDEPAGDDAGGVAGKTPVVRPEDVHGQGNGRAAVLSPDYRQALTAGLERDGAGGTAGPAAAKPALPTVGDPDAGRLFAAKPGPAVPPAGATPVVVPGAGGSPLSAKPPLAPGPASGPPPDAQPGPTSVPPAAAVAEGPAKTASGPMASGPGAAGSANFPEAQCRQLVVVTAADVRATRGTLRRLARTAPDAPWAEVGQPVPCQLGRNGLGAGRGLGQGVAGPAKRQGDGRTPAGLFTLPAAFGYATAESAGAAGVRLPYTAVTDRVSCVTDPASPLFGRVAGPGERPEGGLRQDRMVRDDGANVWGVVIGHNSGAADPEAGTCLFVNVRPVAGPPTGGSIGIPTESAAALAAWLDPTAKPLLAVLPEGDYRSLAPVWGLP
ncbi:hypothetical protein [Solidesulfovibrio aerotolerans]|nr:hypothetical protein [Solidesulfovibrio aerotolerans]